MYSFHAVRDFNATEIVTEIPVGATRLKEEIQIFDDDINEAREEFKVFLTVEGNFTVTYLIRTTVCRIPYNDRKLSSKFNSPLFCMGLNYYFVRYVHRKAQLAGFLYHAEVHCLAITTTIQNEGPRTIAV